MLRDFVTLGVQGIASSIACPNVDTNNFEHKLALISMVQQSQFGSTSLEDPNLHLLVFLEVCDTLKPLGYITTWDELTRAFLAKFFPLHKTESLRNQITTFTQRMMRRSMRHGSGSKISVVILSPWFSKMDACSNFLQPVRSTINAATGGTLVNKTEDKAYN